MMLSEQLLVSYQIKSLSYTWNLQQNLITVRTLLLLGNYIRLDKDKTKLTLTHSGFTNADRLQYDEHNEGWDWYVRRLENFLEAG